MRKKLNRFGFAVMLGFIACMLMFSCQKMLDVEPDKGLNPNEFYKDKFDADDAVIGIYGQVLGLAKQYLLLNELRADLMDVTSNADQNLIDLSLHNVGPDNPYANPKPFYKVILSCNDALKNFDIMKLDGKITEAEYSQRYSDIAGIRSWLYLQLVVHYGQVPYITDPFLTINDLKDVSKYPVLSIEEMARELARFMENVPYKEEYESNSSLMSNIDGYSPKRFFINKKALLGDLYLWGGEYLKAANYYKEIMSYSLGGTTKFDIYKVRGADVSTNQDLAIGYIRYKESDINSLINSSTIGWKSMFSYGTSATQDWEWLWVLQFDKNFSPQNPFIDLFAKNGGSYLVKPSQAAIDMWNSQTQDNGFSYDQRGKFTYEMQNGEPVIMKYIYMYDPLKPLEKIGKWYLNRAANLHLHFSEAANRDGQHKIAYALVNRGIASAYNDPQITGDANAKYEFSTFLPEPYLFEARAPQTIPGLRDLWHRNSGVRGRAFVRANQLDSAQFFDMTTKQVINDAGLTTNIEDQLINEAALELAYEGNRWPDLVRIAIRRNDPTFLADKIYAKLEKAGRPEAASVRIKLLNRENWFLPFKW